jgi:hypothetical protein
MAEKGVANSTVTVVTDVEAPGPGTLRIWMSRLVFVEGALVREDKVPVPKEIKLRAAFS